MYFQENDREKTLCIIGVYVNDMHIAGLQFQIKSIINIIKKNLKFQNSAKSITY